MTELAERKMHRKYFSSLGWALLLYLLIMNACVLFFAVIDSTFIQLRREFGEIISEDDAAATLMGNGYGYLLTILIGMIALRLWKGEGFCRRTLWTRGRPMDFGSFAAILCLFIGTQMAFVILSNIQEAILNCFGLSALSSIESATMDFDTFSMFFYAAVGAPVMEEIIFRGLILRQLQPYGKGFAILMSAFTFGIFHGNIVQIPYTFLVGLVLGYVAVEYNILWAMVLHMINNLVLGDLISRVLPEPIASTLIGSAVILCSLAALIILAVKNRDIREYCRQNPIRDRDAANFFTAPGMIALELFVLYSIASPLVEQMIANWG